MAEVQDRKRITAGALFGIVLGMGILVYYAVPLYDLFCRVTGFGGTTQVAEGSPGAVVHDRVITVRFDATTNPDLPWRFGATERSVDIKVGERLITTYVAKNLSDQPVTGTATYNVSPHKAGRYFNKIQCFCFTEQVLKPGERMEMPVVFFVDPKIMEDRSMDDVTTITLSYTFFRSANRAEAGR